MLEYSIKGMIQLNKWHWKNIETIVGLIRMKLLQFEQFVSVKCLFDLKEVKQPLSTRKNRCSLVLPNNM